MSAVALDAAPAFTPTRRRGHLRAVPSGPGVGVAPCPGRLRLTRRGRLTITVSLSVAVAAAVVVTMMMVLTAGPSTEVVIQPGQTLSEVAATHLPQLPLDQAIVAVQMENRMNTLHVQAGQRLVIP